MVKQPQQTKIVNQPTEKEDKINGEQHGEPSADADGDDWQVINYLN